MYFRDSSRGPVHRTGHLRLSVSTQGEFIRLEPESFTRHGKHKVAEELRVSRLQRKAKLDLGQIVSLSFFSRAYLTKVIWNTNTGRLAARHCETMFWAGDVFAPKCTLDGRPVSEYLQDHFNGAYGQ